jgi:hypothetical protein
MAETFTPAVKRRLCDAGCRFERQGKGDHEIWYSPITKRRFVVDARIRLRHWANYTLKQSAEGILSPGTYAGRQRGSSVDG